MKWSITQNEQNGKWYFSIDDKEDTLAPDYNRFFEQALTSGIEKADIISEKQFESYIEKILYENAPPLEIELSPTFDAKIITSSGNRRAELYIRKAKDQNEPINKNLITTMINNSEIHNIDTQELNKKLDEFLTRESRETTILLAEAVPPKRGADRTLIEHVTKLSPEKSEQLIKKLITAIKAGHEHPQALYDKDFPVSEAQIISTAKRNEVLYSFSEPEFGEEGCDIYGNTIPGLPGNDPFVLDLRNIIQKGNELTALCSGIVLAAQTSEGLKIRIIPYKDATVKAVISEDKMTASLILESGKGAGNQLSINLLKNELNALQLPESSYSNHKLEEAIRTARRTSSQIQYTICKGRVPVAPKSYQFDWHVAFNRENTVVVQKDSCILEITFLENGQSGIDVFGNTVNIDTTTVLEPPQHNDSIRVYKTGNTTAFIAVSTGELSKEDNYLKITTSKIVKSKISDEKENINFGGNLTIQGSIGGYRSVKSEGTLTITGDVGVALIHSKDALTMVGGISGEHRGTLWAKKTITAAFAEGARLLAGDDIRIEEYCFRCIIKTNGTFSLTGNPGSFVGGIAHTARGIDVKNLGDYKKVRTIVSFGQDYLIKDRIEMYEKEIQQNNTEISRIDAELKNGNLSQEKKQDLHTQKAHLLKRNHTFSLRTFALKENFETHIPSEVRIRGTVYPGVILESHGRYYEVRQPLSSVCFTFDTEKGIISYKPLKQQNNSL